MFITNMYQQMNRPNFSTPFILSFFSTYHSVRQRLYNSYWFNFQLTQNTTYSKRLYTFSQFDNNSHLKSWSPLCTLVHKIYKSVQFSSIYQINIDKSVELLWNYRYFHNTKILIHPISSPLEVICQESWYLHFMVPISCRT